MTYMNQLGPMHWLLLIGLVVLVGVAAFVLAGACAMWAYWVRPTLDDLAEPTLTAPPSRTECQRHLGMCAGDPACGKHHCPGHPINTLRRRGLL